MQAGLKGGGWYKWFARESTYCHDDVDEHELGHEDEDDEEDGRDDGGDAAVAHAVHGAVAVLAESVLHDAVPVVARRHAEQRQERHAEVGEVRVLAQT